MRRSRSSPLLLYIKEKDMSDQKDLSFERFCSFDALYDASYRVCRSVRWKDSTINFEENRIETILRTEAELRQNEYFQLVFSCFSIIERGKPRDIRACHINDRLVQNSLCEEALLPELTPKFIYDNCATLKGRGIDFALKRFKKHLQLAVRDNNSEGTCGLRIDIRKYFDSIDHAKLKRIAKQVISDDEVYSLVSYLIDTFSFKLTSDKQPADGKIYYITRGGRYIRFRGSQFRPHSKYYEYEEKSLGLGSQVSQLLALLTLNEVDHFIKEELHIKYYGRYMDDLYLLHSDSKYLTYCKKEIEKKLNTIGLIINPDKTTITRITPIKAGESRKGKTPFKYLKWNFFITETGHIIMVPFKKKLSHQRRKLRKMYALWVEGKISTEEVQKSYQDWRAHVSKGTTHYIIQEMDNYFSHLFKGVEIL